MKFKIGQDVIVHVPRGDGYEFHDHAGYISDVYEGMHKPYCVVFNEIVYSREGDQYWTEEWFEEEELYAY